MQIDAIRAAAAPLLPVLPAAAWLPHALIRKPDGKLDKPPCEGATTADPRTWRTLDDALTLLAGRNGVAGVGFAIVPGLIALDFDHCRDAETGELTPTVQCELERLNSYAYVTPSKTGIRIVGRNDLYKPIPGGKFNRYFPDGTKVEIFIGPTNHYNTFTADAIDGYDKIRDITDETLDFLSGLDRGNKTYEGAPVSNATPERSIQAIRAALAVIPNNKQDWDEWSRIGMAVWRSSAGSQEGFEAWHDWSAKHPCHDAKACRERWQHWFRSPPTRLTFGTLYYEARKYRPLFVPPFDDQASEATAEAQYDPETGEVLPAEEPGLSATPLSELDLENIPPRRWVYGYELVRGFVSVLASPGGTGKTAYTMAVVASVALKRPLLFTGNGAAPSHCKTHVQGRVWLYNLEDPMDEMRRRIKATLQHYRIGKAEVGDRIYINSGRDKPLVIAKRAENGDLIATPIVEELVDEIKRRGIDVIVIDPFVQSHGAEENRNEEMNLVMALWGKVAHQARCAVWLIHHFRKGGKTGDAESIRGAGAIQGAARSMHTMSTMTTEEASKLGVQDDQRWQYVRHDNAKQNMAPPAAHATWYRLASVPLNNGDDEYPDGDYVQAVEAWSPPSPWEGMPWSIIERVLNALDAGPGDGEFYAMGKQARDRWAGHVLIKEAALTDGQAATILKTWKDNGVLEEGQYASPRQKGGTTGCVRVNPAKAAEMRLAFRTKENPVDE